MYVLINKSKLNNGVNSTVNFQKMQILFYSKSKFGRHTNPKLAILRDFAEGCI